MTAKPDAGPPAGGLRQAWGLRSLRAQAIVALVAVVLYVIVAGAVLSMQRAKIITTAEDLETLYQVESTLARVSIFASQAVLKINEGYYLADASRVAEAVELDIESISAGLGGLSAWYPGAEAMRKRLEGGVASARHAAGRSALLELRLAMNDLVADLDRITREVLARHERLWAGFRTTYDSITLMGTLLFSLGVAVFGGIVMVFFRRLAWDLRALSERAVEVVRGYRGQALPVTRRDEVGELMDSVNRMQQILRERERELEVVRQQRFHQEKMVAIGSLAAAVAHEINNPIAAIEGVAQSIGAEREAGCPAGGTQCYPDLILEQTRRIVGITRQLSQLSGPQSNEPEWIDLNALVRATCAFVTFDPRYRDVRMALQLDPGISAAWAVADHVTQILMNLLINAADALRASPGPQKRIEVSTMAAGDFVALVVRDNAAGMPEAVAARAFEEGFTTKEHGSGIGLFMCRTLVEKGGGSIALASRVGEGTVVTVSLPRHNPAEPRPR